MGVVGGGKKVPVGIAAPVLLCSPLPGGATTQVLFLNNGTVPVFIGDGTVAAAFGYPVEPLGTLALPGNAAWYGIADPAAGTVPQVVNVIPEGLAATPSAAQIAIQIAGLQLPVVVKGVPASASNVLARYNFDQSIDGAQKAYPLLDVSSYQSLGVFLTDPGGIAATGHARVWLTWGDGGGPFFSENFSKTANLGSQHAVPVKAPAMYVVVDGNVGTKVTVTLVGYTRASSATQPLRPDPIFATQTVVGANSNTTLLPSTDGYGPATMAFVVDVFSNGKASVQVLEYDLTDTQISASGGAFPVNFAANSTGQYAPTTLWLSRYRHKFQLINGTSAAMTFYVWVLPQT